MAARSEPYREGLPIVAEIASGAVLLRDGRILLLHELAEDRWCLPKGHVDPGESLEAAALREIREETGLSDVTLAGELGEVAYRFYEPRRRTNVHKTSVFFLGNTPGGEVRPEPIFDRFEWVPLERAIALARYDTDRTVLERARRRVGARA